MAFNSKQMQMLTSTIDHMAKERQSFEVPPLSADEMLRAFVKPEDIVTMQRAADLMQLKYQDRTITATLDTKKFSDVRMHARFAGTKHDGSAMPFIPKYAAENGVLLMQVSDALDAHLTSIIDLRIDFEYIKSVLYHLDTLCAVPAHVTFFWPSIRIIAEHAVKLNEGYGSKIYDLVNATTKKSVPAIPPSLRQACKETAEIVTAAHILGKASDTPDLRYMLTVFHGNTHRRTTPIGPISAR